MTVRWSKFICRVPQVLRPQSLAVLRVAEVVWGWTLSLMTLLDRNPEIVVSIPAPRSLFRRMYFYLPWPRQDGENKKTFFEGTNKTFLSHEWMKLFGATVLKMYWEGGWLCFEKEKSPVIECAKIFNLPSISQAPRKYKLNPTHFHIFNSQLLLPLLLISISLSMYLHEITITLYSQKNIYRVL